MGIFNHAPSNAEGPEWVPTVDMTVATPLVFALANAPGLNEVETGDAIDNFVRLSERPSTEQLFQLAANAAKAGSDLDSAIEQLLNRPWTWLAAVMKQANSDGNHHLVLAGLFWACYWTSNLLPRNSNIGAFEELGLCPIAPSLTAEILSLGIASASELPGDFVVAGDETGQLLAGTLALAAPEMLGL